MNEMFTFGDKSNDNEDDRMLEILKKSAVFLLFFAKITCKSLFLRNRIERNQV